MSRHRPPWRPTARASLPRGAAGPDGHWQDAGDAELAGLLARPDLPATFDRWELSLAPGTERPTCPDDWAGTLVLVEQGALEVDCRAGGRRTFTAGDLLVLGLLPLHALRNPGEVAVHLVVVRRRDEHPRAGLLRVIRHIRR